MRGNVKERKGLNRRRDEEEEIQWNEKKKERLK